MRNVGAAWLGSSDSASQTVFKPLTNHGRAQLGLENPPLSSCACVLVDFMHLLAVSQRLQNLSIVAGTGNYRFPYGHAHNVAAPFTQSKRLEKEREGGGGGWMEREGGVGGKEIEREREGGGGGGGIEREREREGDGGRMRRRGERGRRREREGGRESLHNPSHLRSDYAFSAINTDDTDQSRDGVEGDPQRTQETETISRDHLRGWFTDTLE